MTVIEYSNTYYPQGGIIRAIAKSLPSEFPNADGEYAPTFIKDFLMGFGTELTILYYNRSANKQVTDYFMFPISPEIIGEFDAGAHTAIAMKYYPKWENAFRILYFDAFSADYYDPYSLKEKSTDDETVNKNSTSERNDELELTSSGTSTNTRNGSNTQVGSGTTDTNYNTYGFNSSIPVPTDDNTNTVSNEVSNTITDSDIGSDEKTEKQNTTSNNTTTDAMTRQNNLIRELRGNIGNLTRDNISEGRLNMLVRNLIDIIFDDIDSVLTLQYYGGF